MLSEELANKDNWASDADAYTMDQWIAQAREMEAQLKGAVEGLNTLSMRLASMTARAEKAEAEVKRLREQLKNEFDLNAETMRIAANSWAEKNNVLREEVKRLREETVEVTVVKSDAAVYWHKRHDALQGKLEKLRAKVIPSADCTCKGKVLHNISPKTLLAIIDGEDDK